MRSDIQHIVSAAMRDAQAGTASQSGSQQVAPSPTAPPPGARPRIAPQQVAPPPAAPAASAPALGGEVANFRCWMPWVPPVAGMEFVGPGGGAVRAHYPPLLVADVAAPAADDPLPFLAGGHPPGRSMCPRRHSASCGGSLRVCERSCWSSRAALPCLALPVEPPYWPHAALPCPSCRPAGIALPCPARRAALLVARRPAGRAPPSSTCRVALLVAASPCPTRAPPCWPPRCPALPACHPALPAKRTAGSRAALPCLRVALPCPRAALQTVPPCCPRRPAASRPAARCPAGRHPACAPPCCQRATLLAAEPPCPAHAPPCWPPHRPALPARCPAGRHPALPVRRSSLAERHLALPCALP
ncbi:unnamed protein product [Closterium sp. NIES-54]